MKKYEQIIKSFKLFDTNAGIETVQEFLSEKGKEGFRLIDTFMHTYNENSGRHSFLVCIMEKEISE